MKLLMEEMVGKEAGKACAVLGNGPSLNWYDFNKIDVDLIGCNKSYLAARAKHHCVLDWEHLGTFKARKWTCDILWIRKQARKYPIPEDQDWVQVRDSKTTMPLGRFINNTGVMGAQVALLLGYSPVYLLGVDLIDGGKKFHDGPAPASYTGTRTWFTRLNESNKKMRPDQPLVICNPDCPLEGFEVREMKEWWIDSRLEVFS